MQNQCKTNTVNGSYFSITTINLIALPRLRGKLNHKRRSHKQYYYKVKRFQNSIFLTQLKRSLRISIIYTPDNRGHMGI